MAIAKENSNCGGVKQKEACDLRLRQATSKLATSEKINTANINESKNQSEFTNHLNSSNLAKLRGINMEKEAREKFMANGHAKVANNETVTKPIQSKDVNLKTQATNTRGDAIKNVKPSESLVKRITVELLMFLIKGVISIYDTVSQPVFHLTHRVSERQRRVTAIRCRQIDPDDCNSPWRQDDIDPRHLEVVKRIDSYERFDDMMRDAMERNADGLSYGYRQVIHEQWVKRADSDKLMRQVRLTDYKWMTYGQLNRQIEVARRGFLLEGVKAGDKVMIYADTRAEWQISSQALIRLGATVATMYSTLGIDGIVHSVNETAVTHIVTQQDKIDKLLRLKARLPNLKKIIYFNLLFELPKELGGEAEDYDGGADDDFIGEKHDHPEVECMSFRKLILRGLNADETEVRELQEASREHFAKRTKDSIIVIMYTSGSTGIPKGVLISHRNVMATIKSFTDATSDFVYEPKKHTYTAYLPLAHIFEFSIESMLMFNGVKFGFAAPLTLTDKSPGLEPGQVGDLTLLRPTVMIIVPLILDRVVQGIKEALKAQPLFKKRLVNYLIEYKSYWQKRQYETPLVDKLICSKLAAILGGNVKYCICGSAPLSAEIQIFVRSALNIRLPQGFGTTETCAVTSCQLFNDQTTGNTGPILCGCRVKLEPWIEGNYRPSDKPNPRGEIVVGGEGIACGYFNLDDLTKEVFYTDADGIRWYRTGDIGEFLPNGNLKIIDRKRDLVKLQNGEYLSLGRIESTLKSNQFTDNFCVYANSNQNYIVALGPANELALKNLAQRLIEEHQHRMTTLIGEKGEEASNMLMSDEKTPEALEELKGILEEYERDHVDNSTISERKMSTLSSNSTACYDEKLKKLCDNKLIQEQVLAQMTELARERNLMTLEIPKKILLLAEDWTEDKNLVTAAMKIRRNYIYKRYARELEQLYE